MFDPALQCPELTGSANVSWNRTGNSVSSLLCRNLELRTRITHRLQTSKAIVDNVLYHRVKQNGREMFCRDLPTGVALGVSGDTCAKPAPTGQLTCVKYQGQN